MFGCPRCGNDAVYLADEIFSLIRCEFCGDDLDAELLLVDVDHISRGLLPGSGEELLSPLEAVRLNRCRQGSVVCCRAGNRGQHLPAASLALSGRGRMAHRAPVFRL